MTDDRTISPAEYEHLAAEVVALRNRVTVQYRLIEHLTDQRPAGGDDSPAAVPLAEVTDGLPLLAQDGPQADRHDDVRPDPAEEDRDAQPLPPAGTEWWPTKPDQAVPMRPSPGWASWSAPPAGRYVGFVICAASAAEIERAVDTVSLVQRAWNGFVPVFITDTHDLSVFRKRGLTVEYLPPPPPSWSTPEKAGSWLADRREFISRKWGLAQIVDFGHELERGGGLDQGALLEAVQVSADAPASALLAG